MSRQNFLFVGLVTLGLWLCVRAWDFRSHAALDWSPFALWSLWFIAGCFALGSALACMEWAPTHLQPAWFGALVGIAAVAATVVALAASKDHFFSQPEFKSSGYSGIQAIVVGGILAHGFRVHEETQAR